MLFPSMARNPQGNALNPPYERTAEDQLLCDEFETFSVLSRSAIVLGNSS